MTTSDTAGEASVGYDAGVAVISRANGVMRGFARAESPGDGGERGTALLSPEYEPDGHSEPDGDGLMAASCRLKAPLFDRFGGGLIEVGMAGRSLDADISYSASLQHLEEELRGAGNTLSPGGIRVSGQELISP